MRYDIKQEIVYIQYITLHSSEYLNILSDHV